MAMELVKVYKSTITLIMEGEKPFSTHRAKPNLLQATSSREVVVDVVRKLHFLEIVHTTVWP